MLNLVRIGQVVVGRIEGKPVLTIKSMMDAPQQELRKLAGLIKEAQDE